MTEALTLLAHTGFAFLFMIGLIYMIGLVRMGWLLVRGKADPDYSGEE